MMALQKHMRQTQQLLHDSMYNYTNACSVRISSDSLPDMLSKLLQVTIFTIKNKVLFIYIYVHEMMAVEKC